MSLPLIQDGTRNTRVVIVGEAPGSTEMRTGVPFTGGSGDLLNRMLSRAGITRSECFLTNVCHVQPQGKKKNDFDWFFTKDGLPFLAHGLSWLKQDLEQIKPNLVIALGAMPLRALTGKVGIDKWRGSILPSVLVPGLKVISTYHPAFILRLYEAKAVADLDMARCAYDSTFPELRYPERTLYLPRGIIARRVGNEWVHTDESYDRSAIIDQMQGAEWLSADIECWEDESTGQWRLSCCGFSDHPSRALVMEGSSASDRRDIESLTACDAEKVFQNGMFDKQVLEEEGITVRGYSEHERLNGKLTEVRGWDTMLAHHSLYPEAASGSDEYSALKRGAKKVSPLKKGLAFLVSINTREPFYKDDGKLWKATGDLPVFWRYNGLDAATTREIRDVQSKDLRTFGTEGTFRHEMSLVRTLLNVGGRGIPVDIQARRQLRSEIDGELSTLQLFLDTGAGRPINVNSNGINGDIGQLLYKQLGLPIKYHKETGNPTAAKDAILELAEKHAHPLLLSILAIRERRKIKETYIDSELDSDNRLRCSYDPTGTNTLRLSSRATIRGTGQNIQNQPDRIRRLLVALPGYVCIESDYKQAEAVLVAYLAREPALIELFSDPTRDVHTENAARIYKIPPSEVPFEKRYTAKRIIHAYDYGMGAAKAAQVINGDAKDTWGKKGTGITVSVAEAKYVIDHLDVMYPAIKGTFWTEVREQLKRDRILTGVFGTKRTFFGRWDTEDNSQFLNAAYSFKPQNGVGELTTRAMVDIDDLEPDILVVANVHDALWFFVEDNPESIRSALERISLRMAIPMTIHGKTFTIPSEFKIGRNFGKVGKDGSNPQGLVEAEKWLSSLIPSGITG